jgi:hypothetical protein
MDAEEAASLDAPVDPEVVKTQREELRSRDVAVLAAGNPGDFFVDI